MSDKPFHAIIHGSCILQSPDATPEQRAQCSLAYTYSPVVVGVALSLYAFNVAPRQRAQKLYDHFDGACMDLADLERLMEGPWVGYAMTELPMPTATVYVQHALERYGAEALHRVTFG